MGTMIEMVNAGSFSTKSMSKAAVFLSELNCLKKASTQVHAIITNTLLLFAVTCSSVTFKACSQRLSLCLAVVLLIVYAVVCTHQGEIVVRIPDLKLHISISMGYTDILQH
jgi:hypothetical protein